MRRTEREEAPRLSRMRKVAWASGPCVFFRIKERSGLSKDFAHFRSDKKEHGRNAHATTIIRDSLPITFPYHTSGLSRHFHL